MDIKKYTAIKDYLRIIIAGTEFENNVFAVGGCCRDEMLGAKNIKDIDLVVSLENGGIRFAEWLENNKYTKGTVVTYPRFGTAMFRLKQFPDDDLEVVQTRTEVYTSDSRKPDTAYGSIKQDCLRRDLTINAIYYDISNSKMLDVCGSSFDDIKNHIIRTPCDPDLTYIDDPLRIMRCVRFATRLGWSIAPEVFESMKKNIDRLSIISHERINDEFTKIIKQNVRGLSILVHIGACKYIFPNLHYCSGLMNALEYAHTNTDSLIIKLAIIGVYNTNIKVMENDMRYLKFAENDIKTVINIITLYGDILNVSTRAEWRKFVYDCKTVDVYDDVISVFLSLAEIYKNHSLNQFSIHDDFSMLNYKLPVNGNDIMNMLNIKPSHIIKDIMSELLNNVFSNPDITDDEIKNLIPTIYEHITTNS